MTRVNQPTSEQIEYLGSIWGLTREWEICERAARVLGYGNAYARKGRLSASDIEQVIARALRKRGLTDTRSDAMYRSSVRHVGCPAPVVEAPAPAPAPVPAGFARLTARYSGRCICCGGAIRVGTEILYSRARGAMHPNCTPSKTP